MNQMDAMSWLFFWYRNQVMRFHVQFMLVASVLIFGGCKRSDLPFVPETFQVPQGLETRQFKLRMLTVKDALADYEAVMESKLRLRGAFGEDWPNDTFTVEQNRAELAEHEKAAADRLAFTYSVVALDDSRILGCVYIFPDETAEAQVLFWLRDTAVADGLNPVLRRTLESWLAKSWPFSDVNFVSVE